MRKCIVCDTQSRDSICSLTCRNNYNLLVAYNKKFAEKFPASSEHLNKYKLTKKLEHIELLLNNDLSIQDKSEIFGFNTISKISYYFYKYKSLYLKYSSSTLWLDNDRLDLIIIKDYEKKKYKRKVKRKLEKSKTPKKSNNAIDIKARELLERYR